MLFDTDIFIWAQRGNARALSFFEAADERYLSILTLMELLQGAKNKQQHNVVKSFMQDFGFLVLPLTENIGHRALVYVEQYAISHGLTAADAMIAATAAENNLILVSGNGKHFRSLSDVKFKLFTV